MDRTFGLCYFGQKEAFVLPFDSIKPESFGKVYFVDNQAKTKQSSKTWTFDLGLYRVYCSGYARWSSGGCLAFDPRQFRRITGRCGYTDANFGGWLYDLQFFQWTANPTFWRGKDTDHQLCYDRHCSHQLYACPRVLDDGCPWCFEWAWCWSH